MNVLDILRKLGYTSFRETQTHYAVRPLHRESDNDWAVAIDKQTGQWYDFVKKQGGTIYKLAALTKGFKTKKEVLDFLQMDLGPSGAEMEIQHRYELEEVKCFDKNLLCKLNKDHTYWIERGISPLTIATFEGGVASNGRLKDRYVFPIFDDRDNLIGFSGRNLIKTSRAPKWKHIGAKSNWCYPLKWNHHIIIPKQEVILVESIGDMLALWDAGIKNTIVTFGVSISRSIIEFLLRIDAQRILLALNNDEDNNLVGNEAADKESRHLAKHFDEHQIVIALPDSKDFGEMSVEQIQAWQHKFSPQTS